MLAEALALGVRQHGDEVEIRRTAEYGETAAGDYLKYAGPSPDTEVAATFGVKGKSRVILSEHLAMRRSTLLFDKGYTRAKGEGGHTEYSRISVNAFSPARYMMQETRSRDRFKRLHIKLEPRTQLGSHVLVCGSSDKYHEFHKLPSCEAWASRLIGQLSKLTKRQIVYRPKPGTGMKPLPGALYSSGNSTMAHALRDCYCVVTHGATAAMDAVFAGVPAIVLGESVASPVSGTDFATIDDLFWPDEGLRARWANAMAYTQWTTDELRSGEAWGHLRLELLQQVARNGA